MSNPPNKGSKGEPGDYSVTSIVCYQESPLHFNRILYGVVQGPRGGKIVVDLYNLSRLAMYWSEAKHLDDIKKFGGAEDWLKSAAIKSGKLVQSPNDMDCSKDETLTRMARFWNLRYLVRNRNHELYERIKRGILFTEWPNKLG